MNKFYIIFIALISILSSCKKDEILIGNYDDLSDSLELIESRTFSAKFKVNIKDVKLPDNQNEYYLYLEVVAYQDSISLEQFPDQSFYNLGTFSNEIVSFNNIISVDLEPTVENLIKINNKYTTNLFFARENLSKS